MFLVFMRFKGSDMSPVRVGTFAQCVTHTIVQREAHGEVDFLI